MRTPRLNALKARQVRYLYSPKTQLALMEYRFRANFSFSLQFTRLKLLIRLFSSIGILRTIMEMLFFTIYLMRKLAFGDNRYQIHGPLTWMRAVR
jgi:hypothetical protein